jgi:hypothetical protein
LAGSGLSLPESSSSPEGLEIPFPFFPQKGFEVFGVRVALEASLASEAAGAACFLFFELRPPWDRISDLPDDGPRSSFPNCVSSLLKHGS